MVLHRPQPRALREPRRPLRRRPQISEAYMTAHFERALLLYQQDRHKQAIGELQLHFGTQPDDPHAHAIMALCLSGLEKYAEAAKHAETAVHLAPDVPFVYYALAVVQLRRNRFADAEQTISQAIALDPH